MSWRLCRSPPWKQLLLHPRVQESALFHGTSCHAHPFLAEYSIYTLTSVGSRVASF